MVNAVQRSVQTTGDYFAELAGTYARIAEDMTELGDRLGVEFPEFPVQVADGEDDKFEIEIDPDWNWDTMFWGDDDTWDRAWGNERNKPEDERDPSWKVELFSEDQIHYGTDFEGGGDNWSHEGVAGLVTEQSVYIGSDGLGVEGSVLFGIEGSVEGELQIAGDFVTGEGRVDYMAGAKAEGSVSYDRYSGAKAEVEAFVGAKASGEVGIDVGGFGAAAEAEAWVGVGVEASANVSWDDGKVTVGADFGAAFGVGGKFGVDFTVDVGGVVDTVKDGVEWVGDGLSNAWDTFTGWF